MTDESRAEIPPSIGVFDSGLGGLSVLRALREQLPGVPLLYLADSAHAPYGDRSTEFLTERSLAIGGYLMQQGARLLVVACNTATTQAVAALRARWPELPIVGVEPGVKPAAAATRNGRIGVLATTATVRSERFKHLVNSYAAGHQVIAQACPGLVELIERGELDSPALRELVERYCEPLRQAEVDTVVLGCTHYPFIRPLFQQALGSEVLIVDTEGAIARQAARLWPASAPEAPAGTLRLSTTGSVDLLARFAAACLGWHDVTVGQAKP
ncbi:glutamate racemase [Roseateles toxinivorans]|uniref:Glutamate racemase n=1 Tax=Roseateles toxinivorans TaxID=270368 RepID=A0A4R6QTI3_9BURK|nr:glutamate racemase [Roseateles toxinivorans]TDP74169.1 glutamate racemase [Roseateles toxinivorans]